MTAKWIIVNTLVAVIVTAVVTVLIAGYQWQDFSTAYGTAEYQRGYEDGQGAGFDTGYEAAEIDAEGEYYRGVYDVCMQRIKNPLTCNAVVQIMHKNGWYKVPSRGFDWPITDKVKLRSG